MITQAQMQYLITNNGVPYYLADPSFQLPGVYYWDGKNNIHVQSLIEKLQSTLKSIANADTLDWDDPQDFKAWAQSRARWALGE